MAIDRNVINTALGKTVQQGDRISSGFRDRLSGIISNVVSPNLGIDPRSVQASIFAGRSKFKPSFEPFLRGFDRLGASGGVIPNFARKLGDGAFGDFYDLEKEIGGVRAGAKVFNRLSNVYAVDKEYNAAKLLDNTQVNPLFHFPKTLGRKKKVIYKEVFDGRTIGDIGSHLEDDPNLPLNNRPDLYHSLNLLISPFQSLLRSQLMDKKIQANDLEGNTGNTMLNAKAEEIFSKIVRRPTRVRSEFRRRTISSSTLAAQVATSIAKKGGRLGIVDPGLFNSFGEQASNGLVPNYAKFNPRIQLGNLLGRGSYKSIYGINSIQGDLFNDDNLNPSDVVAGILHRSNTKDFEKQQSLFNLGAPVAKIYGFEDIIRPSSGNRKITNFFS